ncbi:hypothetical protein [Polaromonas sp.]|nr:hypothetical protein [Polaromonas sp.]NMM06239.1 hypothetical protein [Polaromonas sp.]
MPKRRDEDQLPLTMGRVRHHDRYEAALGRGSQPVESCFHAVAGTY